MEDCADGWFAGGRWLRIFHGSKAPPDESAIDRTMERAMILAARFYLMIGWYRKRRRLLRVSPMAPERKEDGHLRTGWLVEGSPLWFESRDVMPEGTAEAIACLGLAASCFRKYRVRIEKPVCPALAGNLAEMERTWHGWWNTTTGRFRVKTRKGALPSPSPAPGVGCFLSLGADSFHSVIRDPEINTVIYVGGFDVPLADEERLAVIERHFREAAAALGKRAIFLRSNLRIHPVLGRLPWEKAHGAALAAAAHVLHREIGRVSISSSFPIHLFKPWGTSWKTDHLWSSSALRLEHTGHDLTRFQKIAEIAGYPMVQSHLHVCWEHRNKEYNCGECEKCRRTMIGLLSLGRLGDFRTLPGEEQLIESLRTAEPLVPHIWPTYRSFIENGLPARVAAEVSALLSRSGDH